MSLINQMLRDLDKRREGAARPDIPEFPALRPVVAWALGLFVLVAAGGSYLALHSGTPGPVPPVPAPSVPVSVEAPAEVRPPAPLDASAEPAPQVSPSPQPASAEGLPAPAAEPVLLGLRLVENDRGVRFVAELDAPFSYRVDAPADGRKLIIELPVGAGRELASGLEHGGELVTSSSVATADSATRVALSFGLPVSYRDFTLRPDGSFGHRLVLEIETETPVASLMAVPVMEPDVWEQARAGEVATPVVKKPAAAETAAGHLTMNRRPVSPAEEAGFAFADGVEGVKTGQLQQAEAKLSRALALNPVHLKARELLARLLVNRGRTGEALELYAEGVDIFPKHIPFRKGYARLLVDRGDYGGAIRVLKNEHAPEVSADPEYHALLAGVLQHHGAYSEAAATYGEVVRHYPHMGLWWMGLAIAQENAGRPSEAAPAFEKALACRDLSRELEYYVQRQLERLAQIIHE